MQRPIPIAPGSPIADADTPALVVDMDIFEHNVRTVHGFFATRPAKLRPAVHTHKTPAIAHRQLAVAGASPGVAVVSAGEAEAFASAGVRDIFVTSEVVAPSKLQRLCALASGGAAVALAVDSDTGVALASGAADHARVTLDVLVDVQTHTLHPGVQPGPAAVTLAQRVARAPGLRFAGLMTAGGPMDNDDTPALRERDRHAAQVLLETRASVERAGLPVRVCSYGNSTHDYDVPGSMAGITEVRSGAYAFMDGNHLRHCAPLGLRAAAHVLTVVTSRPERSRAIVDCGQKAISRDFGLPSVHEHPELSVAGLSAEHGYVDARDGHELDLRIGDYVWLTPADVSGAFSLHDIVYATRDGRIAAVWDVSARGRYA